MSAAATAAGYLYASGRLRGRTKDGEEGAARSEAREFKPARGRDDAPMKRKPLRVAALPEREYPEAPRAPAPPRAVKVEYRTRRWRPGGPVE